MTSRPRRLSVSTAVEALGAASLVAALSGLGGASAAADRPLPRTGTPARVRWADGTPLAGRSAQAPGQVVADYRGIAATCAVEGWSRASRAAPLHLTSRLHAAALAHRALRGGNLGAGVRLMRIAVKS